MDQIDLFGGHVKSFTDLDTRDGNAKSDGRILVTLASVLPAGAVHANISFDEPLLPAELPTIAQAENWDHPAAAEIHGSDLTVSLADAAVLIIASGRQQPGFGASLNPVARSLGAPIIADPQCWVTGPNTVAYGDLLASSTDAFTIDAPDIVLRLGPLPTSKAIWTWLEQSGVEQVLVTSSRLRDPLGSADVIVDADPTAFLEANSPAEPPKVPAGDTTQATGRGTFLDRWLTMDAAVGDGVAESLQGLPFPNEPEVARALIATAAPGDLVYLASSMPIRDVDTFAEPRSDIRVLANRGVNGIDGTISTAMGAALAGDAVTLLIGDIAALHDATALAEVARLGVALRVVVINNDGGGIFSFLPRARSEAVDARTFEQHWGTPHGLEFVAIANALGLEARTVTTLNGFVEAVAGPIVGPGLIELRTDRQVNVQQHRAIRTDVRSVLREDVE
jgi:2-succinyl-5-enolpyruvyl-6-hydroxy-3-cyclohexene-1-carboxylate synthase